MCLIGYRLKCWRFSSLYEDLLPQLIVWNSSNLSQYLLSQTLCEDGLGNLPACSLGTHPTSRKDPSFSAGNKICTVSQGVDSWIMSKSLRNSPPFYRCSCGHEHRLPPSAPRSVPSSPLSSHSSCWEIFHWSPQEQKKYLNVPQPRTKWQW